MNGPLVDMHLHLDLLPDPRRTLADLVAANHYVVAVTNAPSVFEWTASLVAGTARVRPALGLHPELVRDRAGERELMWRLLPRTRYVGEVGLDYTTRDPGERALQREVFEDVVRQCDEAGNKILTVHSRRAAADVTKVLSGFRGTAVLHWFSGTPRDVGRAQDVGLFFSVNPAMCRSARGLDLVAHMDPDRVLTESDGPFAVVDGRPAQTSDVAFAIAALATVWRCEAEEVRLRVLANLHRVTYMR